MGKRRNEVPPHIFAIAEGAFQGMMVGGKNQSILITWVIFILLFLEILNITRNDHYNKITKLTKFEFPSYK